MAATVWKGYLTFGPISVPLRLYVAARPEHVGFTRYNSKLSDVEVKPREMQLAEQNN
jgi:non-homologous end joining protein Ku